MDSLWLKVVLALIPLPAVYLLYFRSFLRKLEYTEHVRSFLWGLMIAGGLLLLNPLLDMVFPPMHPIALAFFRAALVEKLGAFIVVSILIRQRRENLVVLESVTAAILIGIGFSAVENIIYATTFHTSVIIARFLSAVPMHAATCGMLGYLLTMGTMARSAPLRYGYLARALVFPWLFHGAFDAALLSGGNSYAIGPILVSMILLLEYMLARSQTVPPAMVLSELDFRYEDWETIMREPQYERWILRSMGSPNKEHVPFFQWHMTWPRIVGTVVLVICAFAFLFLRKDIVAFLNLTLRPEEALTVFFVVPGTYALALVSVGAVNPAYFRNSMIKIPIIADVDYTSGKESSTTITYDITAANCFLQTVDSLPKETPVQLRFDFPGFQSPLVVGEVIWNNHVDPAQPSGTVVRFSSHPPGFAYFLFRYSVFKFVRGLAFNMRLPGFEFLRRFFVRPESVMQEERRMKAGSLIFQEGEDGSEFYLIRKGEVEILKKTGETETVMSVLGKGEIFGELAVVGGRARAATARCRTDCLLAVADGTDLKPLISGNPDFTMKLIEVLANRTVSSESIMTKNIRDLAALGKAREEIFFAALHMLLVGAGHEVQMNSISLRTDMARIESMFALQPETIRALFGFLMRFENTIDAPLEDLDRYLTPELHEAYAKYRIVVDE